MIRTDKKTNRRTISCRMTALFLLCAVLFSAAFSFSAFAEPVSWPGLGGDVTAESAVVIDADTGTVLYTKNMYDRKYPASITKLMTALIVLEKCSLSEQVEFTGDAFRLESGATTAGTSVGDVLSVKDCLYALLFQSANEVANALAIHVSGSIEDFAVLMNERAKELGCNYTSFKNPSGLNNEGHLTSAYDMALIGAACFNNETFLEIESKDSYRIGATKEVPNGMIVTVGHKMLRDNTKYSDSRVKGGKTGYTMTAGNTLVTLAEDEGRRIVIVVLKDKTPAHYTDTKMLLDFGLTGFEDDFVADPLESFEVEKRLIADKVIPERGNNLQTVGKAIVTIPKNADIADIIPSYDYNIGADAPENAVARLKFTYDGVKCGSVYITNERDPEVDLNFAAAPGKKSKTKNMALGLSVVLLFGFVALMIIVISGGTAAIGVKKRRDRIRRENERKERRRERLSELNMSEEDFSRMMEEYRKQKNGKNER